MACSNQQHATAPPTELDICDLGICQPPMEADLTLGSPQEKDQTSQTEAIYLSEDSPVLMNDQTQSIP